ncbi:DUF2784 family protein [Quisquiliibacterium transsilvanicum]|uniref:DUF2784 domain-containing protein n=1 Tax=Quisquiliibacterium transsilvanicum TaxID=1549638 RepID=A0A7W8M8Z1_9BURK|nr:hypothetical protein [Quisquiliibacterium transsilvanicum]
MKASFDSLAGADGAALLADLVLGLHAAFVVFVVAGGLLVLRRPRLAWLHLPAAAWGVAIEFGGWICPLTPLENRLRAAAGEAGYAGDFLGHWLQLLLYPPGLTRGMQIALGAGVLLVNAAVYGRLLNRWLRRR